jgi:hypothetical protein
MNCRFYRSCYYIFLDLKLAACRSVRSNISVKHELWCYFSRKFLHYTVNFSFVLCPKCLVGSFGVIGDDSTAFHIHTYIHLKQKT